MTKEAMIIETFFRVPNKDGEDVDFILNSAQRHVDENLTGRDLIPKARQEGVSTYFLGRYTAKCLTERNVNAALISHEAEATKRLFSRAKYFIENFKGPAPQIGSWSSKMITFPETGSNFYIGTAGARSPFGRGDRINLLHCSEYAYWENSEDLLAGMMDSVPLSGEIALESTGKGIGNPYHKRCLDASEGRSHWQVVFLPWTNFDEYTLELTEEEADQLLQNLNKDWKEIELAKILTPGQLAWRRQKLADKLYNIRHFEQEYPMYLEECFQASAGSLFHQVTFKPTNKWRDAGDNLFVLAPHPMQGMIYSIGADPAGGSSDKNSGDNAAAQIICVNTGEQVGEWTSNTTPPDLFGTKLAAFGKMFNHAFITVESNNHGPVTLDYLRKSYPYALIYDSHGLSGAKELDEPELMQLGFRTTSRSKPIMIGRLRTSLATGSLVIHSSPLNSELSTFIEHSSSGKLEADSGCHDDRVMALACANMGLERAAVMAAEGISTIDMVPSTDGYVDPFSLDEILAGISNKGKRFGMTPGGVGGGRW